MTSSAAGSSSSEAVLEEESELEEQEENSESLSEETPEPSGTEEPEIENRAAEAQEEEIPEEPDGYEIEDFPILWQMPELPTGCEITALTMTLQYYGFDVDKVTMAEEYLPTVLARFYYDSEGNLCGPDLNQYFVGGPHHGDRLYLRHPGHCHGSQSFSRKPGKLPSGRGPHRGRAGGAL